MALERSRIHVKNVESKIKVHNFTDVCFGNKIYFHVTKLVECFYIYAGSTVDLKNMVIAMQTPYEKGVTGSVLFGDSPDYLALNLAKKLAQRSGKQVFVSCSEPYDQNMLPLIERRIIEEMKNYPQFF